MTTELDAAVARLKTGIGTAPDELPVAVIEMRSEDLQKFGPIPTVADARLVLAEFERRGVRIEGLEKAQAAWLASPQAAARLEGYRELGAKCASLETERDAARAEAEQLRKSLREQRAAAELIAKLVNR